MIIRVHTIFEHGDFAQSPEWKKARQALHTAIGYVTWPPKGEPGKFVIHPELGKESGKGNGVKPIKNRFLQKLEVEGWKREWSFDHESDEEKHVKALDVVLLSDAGSVAVEWETGNISSSHRALNKMCLGLMDGYYKAAVLVVPSAKLAPFLTDRIGNFRELRRYLRLWKSLHYELGGVLEIVEVEQDEESIDVPRIPKGNSGNAQTPDEKQAQAEDVEIAKALSDEKEKAKKVAIQKVLNPLRKERDDAIRQLRNERDAKKPAIKNDKVALDQLSSDYGERIKQSQAYWKKRLKEREKDWRIAAREIEEDEQLEALE